MKNLSTIIFLSLLSTQAFGSFDEIKWVDKIFDCEDEVYIACHKKYPDLKVEDKPWAEMFTSFDRRRRIQDAYLTRCNARNDITCSTKVYEELQKAYANGDFTREEARNFQEILDEEIIRKTNNVTISEESLKEVEAQVIAENEEESNILFERK